MKYLMIYKKIDSSETNVTLVNTFVSQSGIDTKKLDIQYVSGDITYNSSSEQYESVTLMLPWDKFSHFGSLQKRELKISTIK